MGCPRIQILEVGRNHLELELRRFARLKGVVGPIPDPRAQVRVAYSRLRMLKNALTAL